MADLSPAAHPITPPPELVEQWRVAASNVPTSLSFDPGGRRTYIDYIATQAARWGADQELEACCALVRDSDGYDAALGLRAERRPQSPSLKGQALEALQSMQIDPVVINGVNVNADVIAKYDTIRRALKQLDD